jgi:DNA ligase D-like protein (predicted polymerase)
MSKSQAAVVVAGGREVRVTSPDRVVYEATERTPQVTKLQVCEYFAAVGEPLLAAVGERPTAMERWPDGWREGMRLATGPQDREGDGFYQKRLPKGAPSFIETVTVTFPSGRTADELCPTEPASLVWAAQMGALTFHPWPVRRPDVDHPDELRLDLDPQPGTTFADARRVAGVAKELLEELGLRGYPKTSGNRGVHIYVRIQPSYSFEDLRHAAIGFGRELERRDDRVTTAWWKEERGERLFLDYNQNNRDRTIASAWSLRARPGAPVSTPMTWERLAEVDDPREFNLFTVADYLADGNPWADMDDQAFSLDPLLDLWETLPGGELNFPPDYPKMPGEPPRVQPSRMNPANWL